MRGYKALIITVLTVMASMSFLADSIIAAPDDPGWPRLIEKNGKQLTIYQPQIDSWQDYTTLHFRCAISVKTGASKEEKFGVVEAEAQTVTDQAARVVAFIPKKRELRFPNISDAEEDSLRRVADELYPPGQALTISLDRILPYLDPDQQQQQEPVELNLDPPKIFYSTKPAILVMFLGEPQLKPIVKDKNDLMFALNTNWDVFYDATGQRYYLLNQDNWLTATDAINGQWAPAQSLPAGLSSLPPDDNWADVRLHVPGKKDDHPPLVFVSTEPAELILANGDPEYSPIAGTKLMRVTNTEATLFLNSSEEKYYFLTAGRWFRTADLEGPWSPASKDLPGDFARIPDDDPAAFVKASVPGTTEAKDAVLLASIPERTVVETAKPPVVEVAYSGEPQFQSIPDTAVQYAANSTSSVFLVDGGYYCCDQGVWYCGGTAKGPWTYCKSIPQAIYTIPASHPAHNVTYVTVQNSTPETVVYTQTSGYSGEYVAATGVLMFGAGMIMGAMIADHHDDHYYYPPYPVPYSYGCGARYNYAYGGYYSAAHISYGPYGGVGAAASYNPYTGTYSRGAYAYGPAGSASVRQAYNPYTGARAGAARVDTIYGSAGRGAAYNPATGTAVRGGYRSNNYGTVAGVQTNRGTGAIAWDTQQGQGMVAKGKQGNVYAGKDGTVYKKDSSGNWSSNSGSGWETVNKPQPKSGKTASTAPTTTTNSRVQSSTATTPKKTTTQARQPSTASSTQRAQKSTPPNQTVASAQTRQPSSASSTQRSRESVQSLESQSQARQRGNQMSQRTSRERSSGSSFGGGGRTGRGR